MTLRTRKQIALAVIIGLLGMASATPAKSESINQSARDVPVAYEVDVAVIGGGVGAVSAAVEAADSGASVFLAAPRPYLGEDMAGMLRLWLEDGEKPVGPLAEQLYDDPVKITSGPHPDAIPFTYEASLPFAAAHKDTTPPKLLSDGKWSNASSESVQYEGDVALTIDLGEVKQVEQARLMAFYRGSGQAPGNFMVSRVDVSISDDKEDWVAVGSVDRKSTEAVSTIAVDVGRRTRYIKLDVHKPEAESRMLLGEIEIVGALSGKKVDDSSPRPPRPMHVKRTLDNALLAAGVQYLYGCQPTEVLVDQSGRIGGFVMSNRAGRQAVLAKTIIDATDRGHVARMAGAQFEPFQPGVHTFRRVVVGGEPCEAENMTARVMGVPYRGPYPNRAKTSSSDFSLIEYTIKLPMADDSPASWAAADQATRTLTYHLEQQYTSDYLFHVPTDPMKARVAGAGPWKDIASLSLDSFRPEGIDGVYVLGGCAQVSREQAEQLLRPVSLMEMGSRIGKAAAAEAAKTSRPQGLVVRTQSLTRDARQFDVAEFLSGTRPVDEGLATVAQPAGSLPVLAHYDVVIIGGGTTGAPAGIGAARQGAKTLVIEFLHELGGVGTSGAISNYYWGNRVGFSATVEGGKTSWVPQQKMEWWRSQLLDAGADIWFGTVGCGAVIDGKHVKGAVVASTWGRGIVLADVVIDTTGNSDIAAAAGAEVNYTDHRELAMQGTGLPGTRLGGTYNNTDFTITDETDMVDVWHMFVYSKDKYADAFDHGKLIDTRERRRIVGDFNMTILDQFNLRTYPDTIQIAYSNFDTHGYSVDPYLELEHPEKVGVYVNVPYRCCLPKGLQGILVGGLGMSVHRDAVPLTRMQPDLQNQGYALGAAAAMASRTGVELRKIDLPALQRHLVDIGNLPEETLGQADSYPIPEEKVAAAVKSLPSKHAGASVILARPEVALPMLRKAFEAANSEDKLFYARTLAVLGDDTGLDVLIDKVEAHDSWDEGWNYRGMGQFGSALSPLDQLIVALGRAGNPRAIDAIVDKAELLTPETEFSHHRAVGLALELIGDRKAVQPLAALLTKPGMTGYVNYTVDDAREADQRSPGGTNAVQTRRESLREVALARALLRCGDYGNMGRQILTEYTKDLRGHFARHAKAVLDQVEP